jgi:hypothetical protein
VERRRLLPLTDGALLWTQHMAAQPIYPDFGTASHDRAQRTGHQLHDNDGHRLLAALDAITGKSERQANRPREPSCIRLGHAARVGSGSRIEIITIGRGGFVISYDTDGGELWRLKGMTQATPTPWSRTTCSTSLRLARRGQPSHLRRSTEREGRHLLA